MSQSTSLKIIGWAVISWAILGAAGTYRFFLTPPELRFSTTEALWLAGTFIGDIWLAAGLLIISKQGFFEKHDK